ncbi:MAG TPA: sugar ABC transporter permease [Bordetella sp.]|nr:sugar ABC transporter permease [Bordetella sp.]
MSSPYSGGMTTARENRMVACLTLLPSTLILILLVAVPAVTVIGLSFTDSGLGDGSGAFVGWRNYAWVFRSGAFYQALINTAIWVFGSVGTEMVLGLGVALLLNRSFFGRGLARAITFAPYLIPTVVAVLVWRYMFHDVVGILNYLLVAVGAIDQPLNWLDTPSMAMFSVIVVGVWKFLPFSVLALLGMLQSIPQEQYEAARIDGASDLQQFLRITLPYVMPVFLLTALLRTIWTFHKFDIIYLMTGGGPMDATTTLPVLVYEKAFVDFEMGRAAAMAIVTAVILAALLAVYFMLIRRAEAKQ